MLGCLEKKSHILCKFVSTLFRIFVSRSFPLFLLVKLSAKCVFDETPKSLKCACAGQIWAKLSHVCSFSQKNFRTKKKKNFSGERNIGTFHSWKKPQVQTEMWKSWPRSHGILSQSGMLVCEHGARLNFVQQFKIPMPDAYSDLSSIQIHGGTTLSYVDVPFQSFRHFSNSEKYSPENQNNVLPNPIGQWRKMNDCSKKRKRFSFCSVFPTRVLPIWTCRAKLSQVKNKCPKTAGSWHVLFCMQHSWGKKNIFRVPMLSDLVNPSYCKL